MNAELMGFNIDLYSFNEGVMKAQSLINAGKVSQVVTINPEMIEYGLKNADFCKIIQEAEMVIPDGVGVKIALKLNGYKAERLPGIDFAYKLLEIAAENNLKVAVIGAKEDVITRASDNLKTKISGLNIVYTHNGYFSDDGQIYNEIKDKQPQIVLVAMGSPRQEEFIYNAKNILPPCLMIGIGGSLDVWSGTVKRAPVIFRKFGLEWLYRTVTQPERIKRIFPALPLFLIKSVLYERGGNAFKK